jgi:hypothetical protein
VSIPADPADLAGQIQARGDSAQLVTVTAEGRPHVVAVRVEPTGEGLAMAAGTTTRANVGVNPGVTLLWPPGAGQEYTLVVDGDASADHDREVVTVRPSSALLHRVAHATGDGPRCYAVDVTAGVG